MHCRRHVVVQCMIVAGRVVDRMAKFDREAMKKTRLELTTLKSTGQPKFALEEEVKTNTFYTSFDNKFFSLILTTGKANRLRKNVGSSTKANGSTATVNESQQNP